MTDLTDHTTSATHPHGLLQPGEGGVRLQRGEDSRVPLTTVDLFCGAAGGWSLGLHRAGYQVVGAAEKDDWRREMFGRRWGVPVCADVRQGIIAPRREHSRKPDGVHERIERLVAGPYCELFARQKRAGWDCFGNETEKFPEAAA